MSCVADLYAKRTAGGRNAEVLVAEATDEIEGLLRGLLTREPQGVGLDLRFDGGADLGCRPKEAIGGHVPVDALVWPLEVVVLDEELRPSEAVREVGEHRLAQKLVPERLPEPFDLAERLWMLRPALAVRDAAAAKQLLKLGRAAPGSVLPPLIRQHLTWLAVFGDAAFERLDDEARLLMVCHRPRHQVPRVVVHEADEVHALMAPKLEREDVALPQLIGLGTLEPPLRLVTPLDVLALCEQAGLVQDPAHRGLRDTQALEPREHVTDAPCPPVRVGCPSRHHRRRRCFRHRLRRAAHRCP